MKRYRYAGRLFKELLQFGKENKVYWIVPVVLILGGFALIIATTQSAAPFVYTLF